MLRLNAQDALLVTGEATGWPLVMASLQVYDGASSGRTLDLERVREVYRRRLPHLPVFRHRLVRVPGGLDRPVWVEQPDVDVNTHVHGVRLPAPGTDRQLSEVVAGLIAVPLDLDRPLWQVWVITGLAHGRVAVLSRLHHAARDGIRGLEVLAAIFDLEPDAPAARPGEDPGVGSHVPPPAWLVAGSLLRFAEAPLRATRVAGHLALASARLVRALRRRGLAGLAVPLTAPRTSLNHVLGPRRGYAFCSLPLGPVKRLAREEGVTVNDVVLAMTGGALRRYLSARGELPGRSLIAAVPVGLAGPEPAPVAGGNRWAVIPASLGTDVGDPVTRLHRVAASARAGKVAEHAVGEDLWQELVDVAPAVIHVVARGYARLGLAEHHPPLVNAVVSDMRGAPFPLYLAGVRLLGNYPVGPIADGFGLNVTVISYEDSLDFGLTVCPDLVVDPWLLVDALRAESEELP